LPWEKGQSLPIFWMNFSGVIPNRMGIRMIAGINMSSFGLLMMRTWLLHLSPYCITD
jgi:hypothetical protein